MKMAKNEALRVKDLMKGAHHKGLKRYVNCAGYALGVNEYLQVDDYVNDYTDLAEVAAWLEADYNLEPVGIYRDAQDFLDQNRTAGQFLFYRVNTSGIDYHFVLMNHRGTVYDKRGQSRYIRRPLRQSILMRKDWGGLYNSNVLVMRYTGHRG